MRKKYRLNIVGASGAVGKTMISVLKQYKFPLSELNLYAGENGSGKIVSYTDKKIVIKKFDGTLPESDFTFFATDKDISLKYVPIALKTSRSVIDNSSAFRFNESVPLVVPEINFTSATGKRLIANPNCSTAICAIPLNLLNERYGIKRIRFFTYQSVSGSGKRGIDALLGVNNGTYDYDIRKTCIPFVGDYQNDGYTTEEYKMCEETRKILSDPTLPISATCVRVPVKFCHAISISVVLNKSFNLSDICQILSGSSDIILQNDTKKHIYPTAIESHGKDKVYIGRIRKDMSEKNSLLLYAVSDNLRRGAAYNAYKIMKYTTELWEKAR